MSTAQTVHTAMQDLRAQRIDAEQYRAIMRECREAAGEQWEAVKLTAFAHDAKVHGA